MLKNFSICYHEWMLDVQKRITRQQSTTLEKLGNKEAHKIDIPLGKGEIDNIS